MSDTVVGSTDANVQVVEIPHSKVEVIGRLRQVDPDYVLLLSQSIGERGQDTPVTVRALGDGKYRLVAGAHRHSACQQLDRPVRAIVVDLDDDNALMVEIDENLHRRELTALDRAECLRVRKEVYLRLYPETANGAQGGRGGKKNENDTMSFSKSTAERLNFSSKTIERAIRIATKLADDVKSRLQLSDLANNQKELLALADLEPADQRRVLTSLQDGHAKSVAKAWARLQGEEEVPVSAAEKKVQSLANAWVEASKETRMSALAMLAELGELDGLAELIEEVRS